jgi:DNA replication protein DnaC
VIDAGELPQTETTEVCSDCFGTGTKLDPVKGAMLCHCRKPERRKRLLAAARIPRRYSECSFENFKCPPGSPQDRALILAQSFVNQFPAVDRGVLFMGPAGVGKTHLAVAIIKKLTEKGFGSVFCEFGALLKQIQDSYNPISRSSELTVLAPVYESDVIVLDELGASIPTDWVRDTMYQIINKRYNDNKLTIFTTNYRDKDLEERITYRLRSRLYEMCTNVVIDGEDYRRRR